MLPNPEDLLALEPEELAGFVIEHFNSLAANERDSLHPDNFVNPNSSPVNKYPRPYQDRVARALMKAWEWLVREGLFARKPSSPGWYFITKRGERIKTRSDLEVYAWATKQRLRTTVTRTPKHFARLPMKPFLRAFTRSLGLLLRPGFRKHFSQRMSYCPRIGSASSNNSRMHRAIHKTFK